MSAPSKRPKPVPSSPLFEFSEEDHLTRIHLRLALEDAGFAVEEDGDELKLVEAKGKPGATPGPPPPAKRQ